MTDDTIDDELDDPPLAAALEPDPEPEPEPEPEDEAAPAVVTDDPAAVLAQLTDRLAESQRLLARQTEIAAALHAENQRLREGELRTAQMPLVRDVLRLHDDVAHMLAMPVEPAVARDLDIVGRALVDSLARSGIEPVACEAGDAFDPKAHKVVSVEPTGDAAADRRIAGVARSGFAWDDGAVVRVADVTVFKYRPAPPDDVTSA